MKESAYTRKLFFISREKHASKQVQELEKCIDMDIPVISPQALMEANPKYRNKILLIDFSDHKALVLSIKNLPLIWKDFETVVFNVPKRLTTDELLTFGQLKGIFYEESSVEQISEGFKQSLMVKIGYLAISLASFYIIIVTLLARTPHLPPSI